MRQLKWITDLITIGNAHNLACITPWKHNLLNLSVLVAILVSWLASVMLINLQPQWLFVTIAGFFLGYIYFLMFILVIHEASHHMFIISRNARQRRFWNRVFGVLFSIPFGADFAEHWERGHIVHHNHPMEDHDPQICNPRTGSQLIKQVILFLLVPGFIQARGPLMGRGTEYDCVKGSQKRIYWRGIVGMSLFWTIMAVFVCPSLGFARTPFFIAGFLIAGQVLATLTIVKTAAEHGSGLRTNPNPLLRQRTTMHPLRFLICPLGLNYHFEHHLNMAVPWYMLRRYHNAIADKVPAEYKPQIFNREIWEQLLGRFRYKTTS